MTTIQQLANELKEIRINFFEEMHRLHKLVGEAKTESENLKKEYDNDKRRLIKSFISLIIISAITGIIIGINFVYVIKFKGWFVC